MPIEDYFDPNPPYREDRRKDDENHIYGSGWAAIKRAEECSISWSGGGIAGEAVEVEITLHEFESLRTKDKNIAVYLIDKYHPLKTK